MTTETLTRDLAETTSTESIPRPTFTRSEGLALALLLGAIFMLAVDFSVLNVALPDLGRDVGLSTDGLQWVVTAFALPSAGLTLVFGRLADLAGRAVACSWPGWRCWPSPRPSVASPRAPRC